MVAAGYASSALEARHLNAEKQLGTRCRRVCAEDDLASPGDGVRQQTFKFAVVAMIRESESHTHLEWVR